MVVGGKATEGAERKSIAPRRAVQDRKLSERLRASRTRRGGYHERHTTDRSRTSVARGGQAAFQRWIGGRSYYEVDSSSEGRRGYGRDVRSASNSRNRRENTTTIQCGVMARRRSDRGKLSRIDPILPLSPALLDRGSPWQQMWYIIDVVDDQGENRVENWSASVTNGILCRYFSLHSLPNTRLAV